MWIDVPIPRKENDHVLFLKTKNTPIDAQFAATKTAVPIMIRSLDIFYDFLVF